MRLYQKNVLDIKVWSAITEVEDDKVRGMNLFNEVPFEIPCDTLISSFGGTADQSLYLALKGNVKELYRIGDCVAPSRVEQAIYDGAKIARTI